MKLSKTTVLTSFLLTLAPIAWAAEKTDSHTQKIETKTIADSNAQRAAALVSAKAKMKKNLCAESDKDKKAIKELLLTQNLLKKRLPDVLKNQIFGYIKELGHSITLNQRLVGSLATYHNNDTPFVIAGSNHAAYVWNLTTGKCEHTLDCTINYHVRAIATYQNNGSWFAVIDSGDNTAYVWDLSTYTRIYPLVGHTDKITAIATYQDKDTWYAITGSYDRTARVWNLSTGECTRILSRHGYGISHLACYQNDDGLWFAIASDNSSGTTYRWNLTTGSCIHYSGTSYRNVFAAYCDNNTPYIINVPINDTPHVNNLLTGSSLHNLNLDRSWVNCAICYQHNGIWFAAIGHNEELRIWNLATGKCEHRFPNRTNAVAMYYYKGHWFPITSSYEKIQLYGHTAPCEFEKTFYPHFEDEYRRTHKKQEDKDHAKAELQKSGEALGALRKKASKSDKPSCCTIQ